MAIFSRHAKVLEPDGSVMTVRTALQLINEALDEYLSAQEGDLDADTRFGVTWFETHGFEPGPYGEAETLSKARNVSVEGVERAGLIKQSAGKVRLLKRAEMPDDWNPARDDRPAVWEATQHLIKRLDSDGEQGAAALIRALSATADQARDLAYRLYSICERKGWAEEARTYNNLVVAWPELQKLASAVASDDGGPSVARQTSLSLDDEPLLRKRQRRSGPTGAAVAPAGTPAGAGGSARGQRSLALNDEPLFRRGVGRKRPAAKPDSEA
jgi:putative DNA methylase